MAPIKQDQMRGAWTWQRSTWSRHVPPPRRSPILFNFGHKCFIVFEIWGMSVAMQGILVAGMSPSLGQAASAGPGRGCRWMTGPGIGMPSGFAMTGAGGTWLRLAGWTTLRYT